MRTNRQQRGFHIAKSTVGKLLLISLFPTATGLFIAGSQSPPVFFRGEFFWSFWHVTLGFYWPVALVLGAVFTISAALERKRQYREAQQYAELHGWHPITRTSWQNRKRDGVQLAVNRAFEKPTFILNIEIRGETTTVDEFETAAWALQFGDWLWEWLLETGRELDVSVVAEKRAEWEQSRSITLYRGQ